MLFASLSTAHEVAFFCLRNTSTLSLVWTTHRLGISEAPLSTRSYPSITSAASMRFIV